MTFPSRSIGLAALVVTWSLSACTSGAAVTSDSSEARDVLAESPPAGIVIRYVDPVNIDVRDVPVLMALDELQSRGYRIERTEVAGHPLIADLLARGDAHIGVLNYQTMWTAIAKGADVRTIAQFAAPTTVLAASHAISSCAELDGRQMGVSAPAGLSQILIRTYLKTRCGGASPQLIVMAESSGRAAALMAGRIDAAVMPGEELIKLELQAPGTLHALMTHAKEFPDIRIDGFHVRRAWAEQHPGAVKDFIRTLLRVQRRVTADPSLLYAEARRRLSLDDKTVRTVADAHLRSGIWDANGGLTPANLQHTIDFLLKAHALPQGLGVQEVSDLSYLNEVLQEIGREDTVTP